MKTYSREAEPSTPGHGSSLGTAPGGDGKRMQRLRLLSEAAVAFSSSLDLDETLSRIAREACHLTGFQRSFILLLDETQEWMFVGATASPRRRPAPPPTGSRLGSLRLAASAPGLAGLLSAAAPLHLEAGTVPAALRTLLGRALATAAPVLAVPLALDDAPVGLLLLADRTEDDAEPEWDREIAGLLGYHATAAIRNAQSIRTVNLQLFETVARGKREWEQTFDAISDGIFISSAARVVLRANQAFAAKFGLHPRDVIGKKCHEVFWESGAPCDSCLLRTWDPDAEIDPGPNSVEMVMGSTTSQITAYPVLDSLGDLSAVVHIVKDITEQKRMQELIIRSEKLRAIGEMASGVAHDFNNLLSSIVGWSDIMLRTDLTPRLQECATAIHQAAIDGTETVKRIQEYTRIRRDTEFSNVDINDVVRGAVELARPRWKDGPEKAGIAINLTTHLSPLPLVRGNPSDLREVILNIILNAVDAMPAGGEIRVRTGETGGAVFVSIADSGSGMSEEVQKEIFDPFFTTKGSSGSGLGLSIGYGIISRHGGEITVESSPGRGSTFTVTLPVAQPVREEAETPTERPPQHARILLIDDDERVLRAVQALLESDGHAVTACSGGAQGVDAFARDEHDLVITDLGMAGLNGWEVTARVKEIAPDTPVVLLTGWGAELTAEDLAQANVDAMIQKPCRLPVLRRTLRQVLSRRPPAARAAPDARASASPAAPASPELKGALRILVVEDNKWFGEALQQRLGIDGHQVRLARLGEEGLTALREERYDLVLCDWRLPDLSGLQVAEAAVQANCRPFVALMTGDAAALDGTLIQREGVDAVLPKPWKEEEMERVLRGAQARRPGV